MPLTNKYSMDNSDASPLWSLSIRQLYLLEALLREKNISRVAEFFHDTQPSVSRTLAKLRQVLNDPLLIRSGNHMVPSEYALNIYQTVLNILSNLESINKSEFGFTSQQTTRQFRIASATSFGTYILPLLSYRILNSGSHLQVHLRTIEPEYHYMRALELGELDLVFGSWSNPPAGLRSSTLASKEFVCLMHQDHVLASHKNLSIEEYLSCQHIAPSPTSPSELTAVDAQLAQHHLHRSIALTVPEYYMVPYVLLHSTLIFTTVSPMAEQMQQYFPLKIVHAPSLFTPVRFYQLWHERMHNNASHRWLRKQVQETIQSALNDKT